jgi:predicted DNA repair protein MutK
MASGFFVLLDDIATLMNDVATMGKVAGKKTAGILGDDLAVNAEKSSGFVSEREVPVLWAIGKGSFINKLIILPIAFLLSYFFPISIIYILVLGGLYLAYEAAEKVLEYIFPHHHGESHVVTKELTREEILSLEKSKIKSAIVTDFILSVEIIIIALGSVVGEAISVQIIVVSIIAIIATVGVYGIVAMIVRMDDIGYNMIVQGQRKSQHARKKVGTLLVRAMPIVINSIGVIGTIALVLVSGGIFVHNIPFIHDLLQAWPSILAEITAGLALGFIVLLIVFLVTKLIKVFRK